MIKQDKISSGYDIEFLMGEEYIQYLFLTSLETGTLPWWSTIDTKDDDGNVIKTDMFILHPPAKLKEHRRYPVNPDFEGKEHPFPDLVKAVYSVCDNDFEVTILPDDPLGANISVIVFPSIISNTQDPSLIKVEIENNPAFSLELKIKLNLTSDRSSDQSVISNVRLNIELVDIDGTLVLFLPTFNSDKNKMLQTLKTRLDREVPFSMAGAGKIQDIGMKVFDSDDESSKAIGVFINLALRKGPIETDIYPPRGNIADAQNFLPKDSRMTYGIPSSAFKRLASEIYQGMAKLKDNSTTEYYYPVPQGGGVIKGINIYSKSIPFLGSGSTDILDSNFVNILVIDIHGELPVKNFPDIDYHFYISLIPRNKDGILEIETKFDLSIDPLAKFFIYALGMVLSIFSVGTLSPLFIGTIVFIENSEEIYGSQAAGSIRKMPAYTSFLETLPHKLMVEKRRWDPLYNTCHQLEIKADNILVNEKGLAISAEEVYPGRRFDAVDTNIIRTVSHDTFDNVTGLYYRVSDFSEYQDNDFKTIYPAVDRMTYDEMVQPDGEIETFRIRLTNGQVMERSAIKGKMKFNNYTPKKVDIRNHKIYKLLVISDVEIKEIRAKLELTAELGRTSTEYELKQRIKSYSDEDLFAGLPEGFEEELNLHMKLEMKPSEFAAFENSGALHLGGRKLEMMSRKKGHGEEHTHTLYYRDIPDISDRTDNLLNLPKYKSE